MRTTTVGTRTPLPQKRTTACWARTAGPSWSPTSAGWGRGPRRRTPACRWAGGPQSGLVRHAAAPPRPQRGRRRRGALRAPAPSTCSSRAWISRRRWTCPGSTRRSSRSAPTSTGSAGTTPRWTPTSSTPGAASGWTWRAARACSPARGRSPTRSAWPACGRTCRSTSPSARWTRSAAAWSRRRAGRPLPRRRPHRHHRPGLAGCSARGVQRDQPVRGHRRPRRLAGLEAGARHRLARRGAGADVGAGGRPGAPTARPPAPPGPPRPRTTPPTRACGLPLVRPTAIQPRPHAMATATAQRPLSVRANTHAQRGGHEQDDGGQRVADRVARPDARGDESGGDVGARRHRDPAEVEPEGPVDDDALDHARRPADGSAGAAARRGPAASARITTTLTQIQPCCVTSSQPALSSIDTAASQPVDRVRSVTDEGSHCQIGVRGQPEVDDAPDRERRAGRGDAGGLGGQRAAGGVLDLGAAEQADADEGAEDAEDLRDGDGDLPEAVLAGGRLDRGARRRGWCSCGFLRGGDGDGFRVVVGAASPSERGARAQPDDEEARRDEGGQPGGVGVGGLGGARPRWRWPGWRPGRGSPPRRWTRRRRRAGPAARRAPRAP